MAAPAPPAGRAAHCALSPAPGLTASQLALRSVEPSGMSLLGLVRHMAEVGRAWFRRRFAAEPVGYLYGTDGQPDAGFDEAASAGAEADFAAFAAEVELARAAAAGHTLKGTFVHSLYQVEMDLRWCTST